MLIQGLALAKTFPLADPPHPTLGLSCPFQATLCAVQPTNLHLTVVVSFIMLTKFGILTIPPPSWKLAVPKLLPLLRF